MILHSDTGSSGLIAGPARWGLLVLVICLAVAFLVLSNALVSRQRSALVTTSLASQTQAAIAIRSSMSLAGFRDEDAVKLLAEATQLIHTRVGSGGFGTAIVAKDGTIIAHSADFPLTGSNSFNTYKVLEYPKQIESTFPAALSSDMSFSGELLLPSGTKPGILIASDFSPTTSWQVVVLNSTDWINDQIQLTKLYLLIAFLCLALLLLVLILSFYLSLATGLSSAINSAVALEEASVRFQEGAGEVRRPLHNIQGLADMLSITEDPDEREGYLSEIKGEVSRIIKRLESES